MIDQKKQLLLEISYDLATSFIRCQLAASGKITSYCNKLTHQCEQLGCLIYIFGNDIIITKIFGQEIKIRFPTSSIINDVASNQRTANKLGQYFFN